MENPLAGRPQTRSLASDPFLELNDATVVLGDTRVLESLRLTVRDGEHTAPSNAAFDASLQLENRQWGVRDVEAVEEAARARGLHLSEVIEMLCCRAEDRSAQAGAIAGTSSSFGRRWASSPQTCTIGSCTATRTARSRDATRSCPDSLRPRACSAIRR